MDIYMISLRKITWDNFDKVISLKVKQEQKNFVAPIAYSLAQAFVAQTNNDKHPFCFAIYMDEQLIGHTLIMYYNAGNNIYGDDDCYVINRFLIDEDFQGKGYGDKAFVAILSFIRTFPHGKVNSVYLSYMHENTIAGKIYNKYGFIDTDKYLVNGEIISRLDLNS